MKNIKNILHNKITRNKILKKLKIIEYVFSKQFDTPLKYEIT